MAGEKAVRLLERVSARERMCALGRRFHIFVAALGAIYLAALCAGRLLGLFPGALTLPTALLVPGVALGLAALFSRRPQQTDAARLIDARMKTQDLYLTAALIEHSMGAYKPLVEEAAEERAGSIAPKQVTPFHWQVGARNTAIILGALVIAVLYLPTYDPFGKQEAQKKAAARAQELKKSMLATALRAEMLKKDQAAEGLSKEAQQKLDDLKKALDQAKPKEQKANLAALQQSQKALSDKWRKESERKLKDAFERTPPNQQFGAVAPQTAEWKQQLQNGNANGLKKELQELNNLAQKMEKMEEGVEKEKLREQLKEQMRGMADFMAREANNAPAAAALNRAMDQLAMAGAKGLDKEAMKALQQSLKLTEMELNALAQNVRDLNALEEGLKAAQLAKQLNAQGKLDGQDAQGMGAGEGMKGYAKLYAKMLAEGRAGGQMGEGEGGAMGGMGPPPGVGGAMPSDPSVKSDFTSEQSKSALTAGKILLNWKTQELAEPGEARMNYMEQLKTVRQGASEAVLKEQVPPGYHEAISKYFDTMEDAGGATKNP